MSTGSPRRRLPLMRLALQALLAVGAEALWRRGAPSASKARKIPIVTVDTRRPPNYTVPGIPSASYTNLGSGETWRGLPTKPRVLLKWLKDEMSRGPERLVIFADGGDMLFGGCSEEHLLDVYHATVAASGGAPIIAGAEFGLWPGNLSHPERYASFTGRRAAVLERFGLETAAYASAADCRPIGPLLHSALLANWTGCTSPASYVFVNSGFLVGPVWAMLDVVAAMHDPINDQRDLAEYMFAHPERVALDYSGSLVLSLHQLRVQDVLRLEGGKLHNEVTGMAQCFIHSNGPTQKNLRKVWTTIASHNAGRLPAQS